MRALSVIGIIMSVFGMITSLYIMTEARCHCYCNDDYLYSSGSVPDDAIGGSLINIIIFIFFLVFSIVGASKNFSKSSDVAQTIPPFQANPYTPFQQPYGQQQYQQQYPNPYQQQNPYQQNPYQQNPPQNPPPSNTPPPTNPWAPK